MARDGDSRVFLRGGMTTPEQEIFLEHWLNIGPDRLARYETGMGLAPPHAAGLAHPQPSTEGLT